ncbi:MAG: endonuclease MutS2 [Nitrospirota bacterium]
MIPKSSLDLLEFHKLLGLVSGFSNSDASKKFIACICPMTNLPDIRTRLDLIAEVRRMSHEGNPLSLHPFPDISPLIAKVRPAGAVLDAVELADFVPVLSIAHSISVQMEESQTCQSLKELTGHLTGFPPILRILRKSIDSEGNILDSASFLLADLRACIRNLEGRIRRKLEELVRDERISLFLQDSFVTTRSGRWVIPVRMDSKGMVPGVVHDVSKSGETAFVEPLTIINLSNELENLIAEQKAEELRILRDICAMIRTESDDLSEEFKTIVYLDVLNSIARFADMLDMNTPRINESSDITLAAARHPLLQLSLLKAGGAQKIVPLDVQLGGDTTVMVITGANAGGKTITIKTIGLLLIMGLSGMPVPADSSSSLPLTQSLLVDIGDEQSIENNLSTFSGHISNIANILKRKDPQSVILIDELGTGTDPEEGAALSCAILNEIRRSGALVFATTHLADIKGFVHRTQGMINASMEFDLSTLSPLYRLRQGEPGQSHALEIAQRYGLPENLIEEAKKLFGGLKIEFDEMIADMHTKRLGYEAGLSVISRRQAELNEKHRNLEKMLADTRNREKDILAQAYQKAAELVADTKRQMNAYLDELRKKEKSERRRIIQQVENQQQFLSEKLQEFSTEDNASPPIHEIKNGDTVFVKTLGYDATVIGVNRKTRRLRVQAKNMEVEVSAKDIFFRRGKALPLSASSAEDIRKKAVSSRLNLIGQRVEEALSGLEHFLNHASLAELQEVTIIHGIGKGLLMKAIREYLTDHPLVSTFRMGEQEEGGSGVTIVALK